MANRLFIIIYACSFLMIGHGLRIKRSENRRTDMKKFLEPDMTTVNKSITHMETTTKLPLNVNTDSVNMANGTTTTTNGITVLPTDKQVLTTSTTRSLPSFNSSSHVGKLELILDEGLPLEMTRSHHGKRHLGRIDEVFMPSHQGRHRRHHGGSLDAGQGPLSGPSPPYIYYNKMISPDGKQEVKEFEILAPNMMIESVQQELNYGPDQDLGGLLLLNAAETKNGHADAPPKRHRKHKASSVVPPMLYMLQHLMQSANNMDNSIVEPVRQSHRNGVDGPLYQFLENAVDLALRNNHEVVEHLLGDHLELDHDNELDKEKDKEKAKNNDKVKELEKEKEKKDLHNDKTKVMMEVFPTHKDDELIVSCPIHHEHHANKNGELVDDDVVLVDECHFV